MRHLKFRNLNWTSLQENPSKLMERVIQNLTLGGRYSEKIAGFHVATKESQLLIVDSGDEHDMRVCLESLRGGARSSAYKMLIICDDFGTKIFSIMREYPEIIGLLAPSNPLLMSRLFKLVGLEDSEHTSQVKVIWEISIRHRQDCEKVKKMVFNSVNKDGVFEGFADDIVIVTAELLSNAFFNAPFDTHTQTFLFKKLLREADVSLGLDQEIEIVLAEAKEFYSIRVKDPFGSLERKQLLDNLERAARKDDGQLRTDGPGSGVGLYTIFEIANEICIDTHKGVYTSIECRFYKTTRKKNLAKMGKNFVIGR